jgi:2-succinyl-6-hydroxy-2,4-cyclohexadiene-1-carboxylate synthase
MTRATFVHGFLGSPADWADVLAALRPGIAADCVALRELGCRSIEAAADALARRLEERPCDVLVGYSMGGRIALELAATRPELAPRLLLLSAGIGIDDAVDGEGARARRVAEDDARAREIARDGLDAFVERWYRQPLFAPFARHASFARARLRRAQGEADFWAACVAGCSPGRAPSRWTALPALASRTLFAAGSLDERYAAIAARARRTASALRVEIVPEAGHVLPLEAPFACARLVERSLEHPSETRTEAAT